MTPRNLFDKELSILRKEMTQMAELSLCNLDDALEALRTLNCELAQDVAMRDANINALEHKIEHSCMNLIARQQPVATDLRRVTAVLKIVTDIERIADHCKDISEITIRLSQDKPSQLPPELFEMAQDAREMFADSMEAYRAHDIELATEVCLRDDVVDNAFSSTVLLACDQIRANPEFTMQLVDIMFILKYIERIADHATNIAEWVIYIQTGEHKDMNQHELPGH